VGDVRYRLQLGAIEAFATDEDVMLARLVADDG
jgi:hypothetical protein